MIMPYYSEAFERYPEEVNCSKEREVELATLLDSAALQDEIATGNVTVAMIRPSLEASTLHDWDDKQAADEIESAIANLGVITKFSVNFDEAAVYDFYGGQPMDAQLPLSPERYFVFANRWEEFVDLMQSGPTTALLLHSPDHDAIAKWREQVGHYDIVARRDPANLRGKFGLDNYNNLIHGSDSIEAVQRELAILKELVSKSVEPADQPSQETPRTAKFLGSNTLELLKVNDPASITLLSEWKQSGEVFSIQFQVDDGTELADLIAKACIKFSPIEVVNDWLQRRKVLDELGLVTPRLFATDAATIIEEYVPYTLKEAYKTAGDSLKESLKKQFQEAYIKLRRTGFSPISLHDVRSRGADVVFVDFGEDLGGIFTPSAESNEQLQAAADVEFQKIIR